MNRINQPILSPTGEPAPVVIPKEKLIWRVDICDGLFNGQHRAALMILGAATMEEAIEKVKNESEGYQKFKEQIGRCEIFAAQFLGAVE